MSQVVKEMIKLEEGNEVQHTDMVILHVFVFCKCRIISAVLCLTFQRKRW